MEGKLWRDKRYNYYFTKTLSIFPPEILYHTAVWEPQPYASQVRKFKFSFFSLFSKCAFPSTSEFSKVIQPFVMLPLVRSTVTSVAEHACLPQMAGFCSSSSTLFHLPPLESCGDFQIVFPVFLSLNLNIIVLQPLSVSVFKSSYL